MSPRYADFTFLSNLFKYSLNAYNFTPDIGDVEMEVILYTRGAHILMEKANKEIIMIQCDW